MSNAFPLISFIVPVFNGERDIVKCLDSLCNQGLDESEYEVICIDDHSSDHSVSIISDYSNTHRSVKLYQHKENKRTGTSCNEGIELAKGRYLWIVGQDDWIEPLCAARLLERCTCDNLDLLLFNYNQVTDDGTPISSVTVFGNTGVMEGKEYIDNFFRNTFTAYLLGFEWRSIISTSYLREQNIRCTEGAIYEDTTLLFKAIYYSSKVASCSDFIYDYRVNTSSITSGNKRFRGDLAYEFSFVAGKEVMELADSIDDECIKSQLKQKAIWFFSSFIYKIVPASNREKRKFYDLVSLNSDEVAAMLLNSKWYVRVLATPFWGYILSNALKPIYVAKHLFSAKNHLSGI